MKTLRILVIRTTPFTEERIEYFNKACFLLEKYAGIKTAISYVYNASFLDDAEIESDSDLDEYWAQSKLNKLQYHIVHIDMTAENWSTLGLRETLYGQSRTITTDYGKQSIQYGRWDDEVGKDRAEALPDEWQPIHPLTVGFLHETCHSCAKLTNSPDTVHENFYGQVDSVNWKRTPTPEQAIYDIEWENIETLQKRQLMQLTYLITMFHNIYNSFLGSQGLLHPVDAYKNYITQGYGVADTAYTLTGHHIGCDYATPEGTAVRAPYTGVVTASGYTYAQGYFCHFQYTYKGKLYTDRYMHLQSKPSTGTYYKGAVVARTGNTGYSTGPHLHLDVWNSDVDLTSINSSNWDVLTVDPTTHYDS